MTLHSEMSRDARAKPQVRRAPLLGSRAYNDSEPSHRVPERH